MDEPEGISGSPPPGELGEGSASRRRLRGHHSGRARAKKVASARVWILFVAIMQVLFGVGFGIKNSGDADQALTQLAGYEADERVEVEGKEYVVTELRAQIERERVQGFAVPIGLGAVFLGLFFWARRAAVPALTAALLLFVTVHAVEAVIDPTTLPRGLIVKVFFLLGLIAGLKAALAHREAALAAGEPAPA